MQKYIKYQYNVLFFVKILKNAVRSAAPHSEK